MKVVLSPLYLKIYLLVGGVGVLLSMLLFSPEDLSAAGFYVVFWCIVLWWCLGATYAAIILLAIAPKTVQTIKVEIMTTIQKYTPLQPGEAPPEIEPGISIGEDILIRFDSPNETPAEFGAKGLAALGIKNRKAWICSVPYQKRAGVIIPDGDNPVEIDLDRVKLPWQKAEDWQPVAPDYENETWDEYREDLQRIAKGYRAWIGAKKVEVAAKGKKGTAHFESFTRVGCVLALCLFAFTLSAQTKSEQVATFLGQSRVRVKPAGLVVFRFEKLEITRDGDGSKSILDLLKDGRSFVDADNAGILLGISVTIGNKLVSLPPMMHTPPPIEDLKTNIPAGTSRKEMQDFVRPHQDTTSRPTTRPDEGSVPSGGWVTDSTGMATKLNDAKEKLSGLVLPLWNGVMIGVDVFYYSILYLLGISRFAAIICNNETRINAWGQRVYGGWMADVGALATALTFAIAFVVALIVLTNIYFNLLAGSLSGLFSALFTPKAMFAYGWIGILYVAARAFDKWVPNPKIINRGNYPAKRDQ